MAPGRGRARTARDDGQALPLSALLSQLLVAFTIEFDSEFEHQLPHRTTRHGSTPGAERAPWLVSMPMWVHCMRHVPADGIPVAELIRRSKLERKSARNIVQRMSKWWGYLTVDGAAKTVRPTAAGLQAQRVWAPLTAAIEARWQQRLGAGPVGALADALRAVDAQFHVELPDFLPVGSPRLQPRDRRDRTGQTGGKPDTALPALLSRVLLALALDFEDASDLSLGVYTDSLGTKGTGTKGTLRAGLEPYPDGWRARVPAPRTLPRYPVISARGGFPDGH